MKRVMFRFLTFATIIATISLVFSCKGTGEGGNDEDTTKNEEDTVVMEQDEQTPQPNTLTDAEKAEGWELLFDGETSNGWHGYGKDGFPEAGWKVEDGMLTVIGSGKGEAGGKGGDIITDEVYENFEFKVDWMVTDSANSGIFILVQEKPDARIFYSAPEMQVLDNDGHRDSQIEDQMGRRSHVAGSLYDLIPAPLDAFKGANEWNEAYIKKDGDHVIFKLNGVETANFTLWNDEWKEMVENSKFNQWDLFGTAKKGNLGLQDHGDTVHFRNIKIKVLD